MLNTFILDITKWSCNRSLNIIYGIQKIIYIHFVKVIETNIFLLFLLF